MPSCIKIWLALLIAAVLVAIARIQRLRARDPFRRGGVALALVCAMTVVAIVMCVLAVPN